MGALGGTPALLNRSTEGTDRHDRLGFDSGDGQVTGVNVCDTPGAIADFYWSESGRSWRRRASQPTSPSDTANRSRSIFAISSASHDARSWDADSRRPPAAFGMVVARPKRATRVPHAESDRAAQIVGSGSPHPPAFSHRTRPRSLPSTCLWSTSIGAQTSIPRRRYRARRKGRGSGPPDHPGAGLRAMWLSLRR